MKKNSLNFGLDIDKVPAFSLKGILGDYSTLSLHTHTFHQVLTIKNGITLLEDGEQKQPLYGDMAAFIPVEIPHRSVVIGEGVSYQSLYFNQHLFKQRRYGIILFEISELGVALLNRLNSKNLNDLSTGFMGECLKLFLDVLAQDIKNIGMLIRIPEAKNIQNKKIIEYIHENYSNRLRLHHFRSVLPLSTRHISRIFQKELKITIFEYIRLIEY